MPAQLHLICGSTGAGKTTYAISLADREAALRLSIDEWMVSLFGPDQPQQLDFGWMMERVNRCEQQMWAVTQQVARAGMSVIIDCGLTQAEHRSKWAELARSVGLPVRLHFLDIEAEKRWRRVQSRNLERGTTYRLEVTREMFDFVETLWEPPNAAEMQAMSGIRVGEDGSRLADDMR